MALSLLPARAQGQGESDSRADLSDQSASTRSLCGWKNVFWGPFIGNLSSSPQAVGISG